MATYDDGVPEDWYPGYFLDPRPARRLLRRRHHRPQQAAARPASGTLTGAAVAAVSGHTDDGVGYMPDQAKSGS